MVCEPCAIQRASGWVSMIFFFENPRTPGGPTTLGLIVLHIEQYIWHDSLDYKPKSKCDTGDELTRKYINLQESTQVFDCQA